MSAQVGKSCRRTVKLFLVKNFSKCLLTVIQHTSVVRPNNYHDFNSSFYWNIKIAQTIFCWSESVRIEITLRTCFRQLGNSSYINCEVLHLYVIIFSCFYSDYGREYTCCLNKGVRQVVVCHQVVDPAVAIIEDQLNWKMKPEGVG